MKGKDNQKDMEIQVMIINAIFKEKNCWELTLSCCYLLVTVTNDILQKLDQESVQIMNDECSEECA